MFAASRLMLLEALILAGLMPLSHLADVYPAPWMPRNLQANPFTVNRFVLRHYPFQGNSFTPRHHLPPSVAWVAVLKAAFAIAIISCGRAAATKSFGRHAPLV